MPRFYATLAYDLSPETPLEATKLLRVELAGRRWQDRSKGAHLPRNTWWTTIAVDDGRTTSDLHERCCDDLRQAAAAVVRAGLPIDLLRAWVHVSGSGSFGPDRSLGTT